jgi:hypothetical protein
MSTSIEILPPLNAEAALAKREEIDTLLDQISAHQLRLAHSYARLGSLLREVKINQYWITFGFQRFSSYLETVCEKIDRRRSQAYAILSVAETLLPLISEEQLEAIGITRAHELRRLVDQGGSVHAEIDDPDDRNYVLEIMEYAARPKVTAALLRVKVNELLHCHEGPAGNWTDLGGFYATAEDRAAIEQFWGLGRKLFAPPDEQADHVWRHDVFIAAVQECLGTWVGAEHEQNHPR